jgi:hypothetical protein
MDPSNGSFKFCRGAVEVGPGLTRSQFLESALAQDARVAVQNEPWCSWDLAERPDGAPQLCIRLSFHSDTLESIALSDTSIKERTWEDWSREEERRREERHAQWLRDVLGRRTTFAWGTVWSGYDEKGGFASIVIRYARS